jgi:uncharacterized protein (DUF849 family)
MTAYAPLIVNAALTGMVATPDRVPYVPITVERIADDAERCWAAGATIVHLHARDGDGRPDWRRAAYAELIPELRRRCPGLVVCVTTSGREDPTLERRADVLTLDGDARPDMASLTLGSLNFHSGASVTTIETAVALAETMAAAGIAPELEIFDLGMAHLAHRLADRGLLGTQPYANLLLGFPNSAPADARTLVALVEALPAGTTWAAAGFGAFQAPANALAVAMGGHVRTGLEDNPYLDHRDRTPATNVELVERAVAQAQALGRPVATPAQTRAALGLAPIGGGAVEHTAARGDEEPAPQVDALQAALHAAQAELDAARGERDALAAEAAAARDQAATALAQRAAVAGTRRWRTVQAVLSPVDRARARRRAQPARRPVPFVVGVARSGTTLLRLQLDAHPELAMPPETGLGLVAERLQRPGTTPRDVADALIGLHPFADLGFAPDELRALVADVRPWTAADGVRAVYRRYAERHGKARWGDKTPIHCLLMPELHALLPEARFVHLIRDPRGVAESLRGLHFAPGDGSLEAIGKKWRDEIAEARAAGAALGDRYLEVRYEEYVRAPEPVLREVCAAIDLPYDPAMLHAHEHAAARFAELPEIRVDGAVTRTREQRFAIHADTAHPPDPAIADAWRTKLTADEQARVVAAAGPLMGELGYA